MSSTPEFAVAAVAAPCSLAAGAGQAVLAQGGNALEAAVAVAAALTATSPGLAGIGGDAVWVIREPGGRTRCIEACGMAGERATIRRYFDNGHEKAIPAHGPLAALTVPGAVAGWAQALDLSRALGGRLPLADLLRDAIRHAREGASVGVAEARRNVSLLQDLKEAPGFASAFLDKGEPLPAGALRKQEVLAEILDHLAHAGLMDFYRGDVAREIASDLSRMSAPVTRDDLRKQDARWRTPFSVRLRDATTFNASPPTQGLATLMIAGLLEHLTDAHPESFEHVHAIVEAAKRAFAVRDRECVDVQWPTSDPERWLAADALERDAQAISMTRAAARKGPALAGAGAWFGAIDPSGLAVSCLQSLNREWGSGCVLPATGVLMGNSGIGFALDDKSVHALHPGRRPFSGLNPSLAAFDDGRVAIYGATGGDCDPQAQAQILARLRSGISPDAAVEAPRFSLGAKSGHDGAILRMEDRFDPSLVRALERAGHEVDVLKTEYSDALGHAGAMIRARNGRIRAAHDPRADGAAAGL